MMYNIFKTLILCLLIIITSFSSCKYETVFKPYFPVEINGAWINPEYHDTIVTYHKSTGLIDNEYGIEFYSTGKLIERKNAGWCGTPPVIYADFEGTWTFVDSVININVSYWGGITACKWKIISTDNDELKIYQISWQNIEKIK